MAWVVSIREIKHVEVFVEEDRRSDTGRIPGVLHSKLEETFLPRDCWNRILCGQTFLPTHRGAGPCGTLARSTWKETLTGMLPLEWSVKKLLEPLAAYYATYVPPLQFGAKQGPRGRRVA